MPTFCQASARSSIRANTSRARRRRSRSRRGPSARAGPAGPRAPRPGDADAHKERDRGTFEDGSRAAGQRTDPMPLPKEWGRKEGGLDGGQARARARESGLRAEAGLTRKAQRSRRGSNSTRAAPMSEVKKACGFAADLQALCRTLFAAFLFSRLHLQRRGMLRPARRQCHSSFAHARSLSLSRFLFSLPFSAVFFHRSTCSFHSLSFRFSVVTVICYPSSSSSRFPPSSQL